MDDSISLETECREQGNPAGVVVVDDYCDPAVHDVNNILPGVKRACDEFFADKPEEINVLIAGAEAHGFFRKE